MRKLRFLTAMFSILVLAACGGISPTGVDDPCEDPDQEEACLAGTIGSNN